MAETTDTRDDTTVVTRFAPSPTGELHIGGARTALFNWLFARNRGGQFLLRIEDTDRARSTAEATDAIFRGLDWLGLDHDGAAINQAARADRHAAVAQSMLAAGHAFKCFATPEEIAAFRDEARAAGRSTIFRSPWRDADPSSYPDGPHTVRLRAPRDGEIAVEDAVQGPVTVAGDALDDMILLRSDGTPTYMLAVVVDDHDMGVTHVIRGDDHLSNTPRQALVFRALGWTEPVWAHIPLIHGPDGRKLSKRHGATGVEAWRAEGYPPEAMRNYLARLGWSHGDEEVFTTEQALAWFDLSGIGRSSARLDPKKLLHISGRHIAAMDDDALLNELQGWIAATGRTALISAERDALARAMPVVKGRARTLPALIDEARFALADRPITPDEKAGKALSPQGRGTLGDLTPRLNDVRWDREALERAVTAFAADRGEGLGQIAGPVRAALAGRAATPSIFDMMVVLGRNETLARLRDAAA